MQLGSSVSSFSKHSSPKPLPGKKWQKVKDFYSFLTAVPNWKTLWIYSIQAPCTFPKRTIFLSYSHYNRISFFPGDFFLSFALFVFFCIFILFIYYSFLSSSEFCIFFYYYYAILSFFSCFFQFPLAHLYVFSFTAACIFSPPPLSLLTNISLTYHIHPSQN